MRLYQCHRVVHAVKCIGVVFQTDGSAQIPLPDGPPLVLSAKLIASRTNQEVRSGYAYRDWDGTKVRWMAAPEFEKYWTMLPEQHKPR